MAIDWDAFDPFGELERDEDLFDENDWADEQIKAAKEEPEYYRSIL